MGLPTPIEREEMYLSNIAGQGTPLPDAPISREEMYLDYIAKNGGGGGTGEGDMKKSVYDSDLDVATAGGIKSYVSGAISDKVDKVSGKGLSTNDYDNTAKGIVDGVPSALGNKADASTVNAILDGQSIDSFGDVETALASKTNLTVVAPAYNSSASYEDDDLVTNAGVLQRYDGVAEPWVTTTVAEELKYKQPITNFNSSDFSVIGTMGDGHSTRSVSLNKDSAPTANSTKPVESGGVYTVLAGIKDGQSIDSFADVETALAGKATPSDVAALINDSSTAADKTWSASKLNTDMASKAYAFPRSEQAVLGAKNFLKYPYSYTTRTQNNVTFTDNGDGSITVETTDAGASGNTAFLLMNESACKSYFSDFIGMTFKINGGTSSVEVGEQSLQVDGVGNYSTGDDLEVTVRNDLANAGSDLAIKLLVRSGKKITTPITVRPMLSFDGGTYIPPAMTNKELTDNIAFPPASSMTSGTIVKSGDTARTRDVVGGYKKIKNTVFVDIEATANMTMAFSKTFPELDNWGIMSNMPTPVHRTALTAYFVHENTIYAGFAEIRKTDNTIHLLAPTLTLVDGDKIYIRGTYEA